MKFSVAVIRWKIPSRYKIFLKFMKNKMHRTDWIEMEKFKGWIKMDDWKQ